MLLFNRITNVFFSYSYTARMIVTITLFLSVFITIMNLKCITSLNLRNDTTEATTTTTNSFFENTEESNETTTSWPSLGDHDAPVQCKYQPDSYQCSKPEYVKIRWYYDIKMGGCKKFKYYRCPSDIENNFETYQACRDYCRYPGPHPIDNILPENAACALQPDFGDCDDYIPMWYFDISTRRCNGFSFSGCGGNQNRFTDDKACQAVCTAATEGIHGS